MRVRSCPLTVEEVQAVRAARGAGHHVIRCIEVPDPHDTRSDLQASFLVPDGAGSFRVATLERDLTLDGKLRIAFNTCIEPALEQPRLTGRGM